MQNFPRSGPILRRSSGAPFARLLLSGPGGTVITVTSVTTPVLRAASTGFLVTVLVCMTVTGRAGTVISLASFSGEADRATAALPR